MKERQKVRLVLNQGGTVLVIKKKRNIRLNDLNYYQKRSLKQRLLFNNFPFRNLSN